MKFGMELRRRRAHGNVVVEVGRLKARDPLRSRSFSIYLILPAALGPRVYPASNRNECHIEKKNVSGE
jgi:hypothetical protein